MSETISLRNQMIPINGTGVLTMNKAANVTSVTYSFSPPSLRSTDTLWVVPSENPSPSLHQEPLFVRQGDYWVIRYQGRLVFLKATRGLHCLSLLLQHPGREFHVSELAGWTFDGRRLVERGGDGPQACQSKHLSDAGPILDAQARNQYKRRLSDLRADLSEAERFNDTGRAEDARAEINFLAAQLASAVGLGGRNRKAGSEAERARSAVTKGIKDAVRKIGEVVPALRSHLAGRIRTGYFCSYNLNSERPIAWKFQSLLVMLVVTSGSFACIAT